MLVIDNEVRGVEVNTSLQHYDHALKIGIGDFLVECFVVRDARAWFLLQMCNVVTAL